MRFCLVTTFYPPWSFGGDGVFVERLAGALARRGHQVRVLCRPDAYHLLAAGARPPAPPPAPGVEVEAVRGPWGRWGLLASHQAGRPVFEARALRAAIEDGDPEVIHFHNISLLGGPGVLAYGRGVKLCTLHDYWFVCPMHVLWRLDQERCHRPTCLRCCLAGGRPPQLWRATAVLDRAARNVDAFLAPSRFAARLHTRRGFPAPLRVLPHFAAPPREPGDGDPEPLPQRPYFLCAGRLEKLKGIQVLLEHFRRRRGADLLIAGSGSLERELRRLAEGADRVRFLGAVSPGRLHRLYGGALATVVPSLCYETFGLVPAESFAAGTPVIVRGGGALEEVVEDGGGLVFREDAELEEALRWLEERPGLRRELGAAAYRSFQRSYSEEVHIQRYLSLIEELTGELEPGRRGG